MALCLNRVRREVNSPALLCPSAEADGWLVSAVMSFGSGQSRLLQQAGERSGRVYSAATKECHKTPLATEGARQRSRSSDFPVRTVSVAQPFFGLRGGPGSELPDLALPPAL